MLKFKLKVYHILIIIILLVFAYEYYLDSRGTLGSFINYFGFSYQGILGGRYWIFLTSIFLHADAQHIILNLIALFFFGSVIEETLGWKKLILIFIATGIVGNLFVLAASYFNLMSIATTAGIPIVTIGASAAIFGLLGTAMLVKPFEFVFYPYLIPVPLILVAFIFALFNVTALIYTIATNTHSEISFISHIGGLVAGMAFGFKEEGKKRSALVIMFLLFLIFLTPFIIVLFKYLEIVNYINIFSSVFK
jgi:membrane associated rhomboid family serine protease